MKIENLYRKYRNNNGQWQVLDVRSKEEYHEAHIPGAINIPHDSIEAQVDSLDKGREIAIYCRSGRRAKFAKDVLIKHGFDNIFCVDDSGMEDWLKLGYPSGKGA